MIAIIVLLLLVLVALSVGGAVSAYRAHRLPVVTGQEELIGQQGMVEFREGIPWVCLAGEYWQIHCSQPLQAGQRITVQGIRGLILDVIIDERSQH